LRLLQSDFDAKQAQTAQERIDRVLGVEYLVRAPTRGRVASTAARPGESVVEGQTLMTILPADSPLQAELYVTGSAIASVNLGQPVRLRYAAYPYMKYGQQSGRVASISRAPLSGQELTRDFGIAADAQSADAYYRVVVRLDGQQVGRAGSRRPLLPGMLVQAELMGRKRRLVDWIFSPAASLVASD
jgi:membrane fusion protein